MHVSVLFDREDRTYYRVISRCAYSIADMAVHQVSWSQRLCSIPGMVVWLQTYRASSWQALEHQEDDTVALPDAEKPQGRPGQAGLAALQQTAGALHWMSASWLF